MLDDVVSNHSLTYCSKIRREVTRKFGFLSQNHGFHEYLRRCSRVSLTATQAGQHLGLGEVPNMGYN